QNPGQRGRAGADPRGSPGRRHRGARRSHEGHQRAPKRAVRDERREDLQAVAVAPLRRALPAATIRPVSRAELTIRKDLLEHARRALAARYTIDREIGRGGAARVFLALDREGRSVARKVLDPELTGSVP